MSIFGKLEEYAGHTVIWFDRFCNWSAGRVRCGKYYIWSRWGGATNETISHTLGLEEAEWLMVRYLKVGDAIFKIDDIPINSCAILGELSSDLCDIFQPWHALRSIHWDRKNAQTLLTKYPGIDKVVKDFLKSKGITD